MITDEQRKLLENNPYYSNELIKLYDKHKSMAEALEKELILRVKEIEYFTVSK